METARLSWGQGAARLSYKPGAGVKKPSCYSRDKQCLDRHPVRHGQVTPIHAQGDSRDRQRMRGANSKTEEVLATFSRRNSDNVIQRQKARTQGAKTAATEKADLGTQAGPKTARGAARAADGVCGTSEPACTGGPARRGQQAGPGEHQETTKRSSTTRREGRSRAGSRWDVRGRRLRREAPREGHGPMGPS